MTIDPIMLTEAPDDDFFECAKEKKVFYIQTEPHILISNMIDIKRSTIRTHYNIFATVTIAETFYWFDGKMIKKEEWFDSMIRDYPEYFEWYLFHPEHMLGDETA